MLDPAAAFGDVVAANGAAGVSVAVADGTGDGILVGGIVRTSPGWITVLSNPLASWIALTVVL